jgi:6-phosphogluconolactonase/glucosamine-6-phosphate isomerase/deaminase
VWAPFLPLSLSPSPPSSLSRSSFPPAQAWFRCPDAQLHPINPSAPTPAACAEEYEAEVRRVLGGGGGSLQGSTPSFDMILLGMGPDGHTASLFPGAHEGGTGCMEGGRSGPASPHNSTCALLTPQSTPNPPHHRAGHPLLKDSSRLIAEITDSPKPPPTRVTFTYRLIAAASRVAFVALGEGKAAILASVFDPEVAEDDRLPAARVRQAGGKELPTWFVDPPAVSKLPQ